MARTPRFTVRVDGYQLTQVNSLQVRFSMRELADSFSVQLSDRVSIGTGAPVELRIEGRVVLVGEVQTSRLAKSAGTRDLTITGYSAAQRLVKSSVVRDSSTFSGMSLREIVTEVAEPFGLVVDVSEGALGVADKPMAQVRLSDGEKAHDFLAKLAKRQGCILVSGAASVQADRPAKSSIRITRVAVRESPIPIVYPAARVLGIEYEDDTREVHSNYYVTRKGKGTLDDDGTLAGPDGRATDERVPYSPIIIKAEKGGRSEAAMARQAEWEMRKRAAEGQRVSVTVDGWSPNNSQALWWPNTLYRIVDTDEGFDDRLVLASVELTTSAGQSSGARLEFMPPDAYAVLGKNIIAKGSRAGYKASKEWLSQHAELVTKISDASDTVDFDKKKLELFWKPEDPGA